MRLQATFALLFCCAQLSAQPPAGAFEQADRSGIAWRARRAGVELLVLPGGFVLRKGSVIRRFAWDSTMDLTTVAPEEPLPTISYQLAAPGGLGAPLARAARVRVTARNRGVSVLYYVGPRGIEFNVELEAGAQPPLIRLESVDKNFSVRSNGSVTVDGEDFLLRPVAWEADPAGQQSVSAAAKLDGPRHLIFELGAHDADRKTVLDPVMTYATYFAGTGDDEPVALREMPDGTVFIAGNTASIDLPQGLELNGILTVPSGVGNNQQCFITRLTTATKQILYTSYFGGPGFSACSSMDMDSSGKIFLVGVSEGSPTLATAGAQFPWASYSVDGFLAQISADGKTLLYSTYLDLDLQNGSIFVQAGTGGTAHIGVLCQVCAFPSIPGGFLPAKPGVALLRYNIAAKSWDQATGVVAIVNGFFNTSLNGMVTAPSGAVCLFGNAGAGSVLVQNAFQLAPPTPTGGGGFITAVSPDYRSVAFSSYFGGQNGTTTVDSVLFNSDGSLWISGIAEQNSISGLQSPMPFSPGQNGGPFVAQVTPGTSGITRGFLAGGYQFDPTLNSVSGLVLANGQYCIAVRGPATLSSPDGAVVSGLAESFVPLMGCLNTAGTAFQSLTATGSEYDSLDITLLAPSQAGGIWSLQLEPRDAAPDVIPFDFKAAAIEPYPPGRLEESDDLVLRYINLGSPNPTLSNPQQVELYDAPTGILPTVLNLSGSNFAYGMQLSFQGSLIPLTVTGPTTAVLSYFAGFQSPGTLSLTLTGGTYTGQLVIPLQPEPLTSAPFPVIVNNLSPVYQPFATTADPLTFFVVPPVYSNSRILWNGIALPLVQTGSGTGFQVQIPADLAPPGPGEFTLVNPPPGGGVQRETILIGTVSSSVGTLTNVPATRLPAYKYQLDHTRGLLYTVVGENGQWVLSCYALAGQTLLQSATVPSNGSMIADFEMSVDGSWLWLYDDQLRVRRFRTDTLVQDADFQLVADAPPNDIFPPVPQVLVLADSPQSAILVTPAGQLAIYDGDQPRPYTTNDFPDANLIAMDPVLATSTYVYALERPNVYSEVPCLARYPVDGLGFGPPQDVCNLGANWGQYPEMKTYAGVLVLEDSAGAYGIMQQPDMAGNMRVAASFDPINNVVSTPVLVSVGEAAELTLINRLDFASMDTGQTLGHYPPETVLLGAAAPGGITFPADGSMLFQEMGDVAIISQWQSAIQQYSSAGQAREKIRRSVK